MDVDTIHTVTSAVPNPMVHIDSTGLISSANPAALSLLGEWIVGRSYDAVLRQPAVLARIEDVLGGAPNAQARMERSDQSGVAQYLVHLTGVSSGLLLHFTDITHLSEAAEMRRGFVANVSHELRTPLTSLLGFIETLRGPARNDAAAQDRFLGIMQDEAQRMNRLISDLLSLSRVEADERVRPNDTVDLHGVLETSIAALRPRADASETSLVLEVDPEIDGDALIQGDRDQLMQVVLNLSENAMKYGGHGNPVTLHLSRGQGQGAVKGDVVILTVTDEGPGIASQHLPRLTERFYRIDSHRAREMGGTGLGLAIVKHIVNRHRGRLRITSEIGKGSSFSVEIPAWNGEARALS